MVLVALAGLSATLSASAVAASTKQNFQESLNAVMAAENGPPGISVQIIRNGKSEYFRRGEGNIAAGTKPKLKQHFRIASVSKAFSGKIALLLVTKGRLRFSDTIGLMAEAVTGRSYNKMLKQHVYKPMRLKSNSLPRTVNMPRPYLRGYSVVPGQPPEDSTKSINPALAWASGGMVSLLPDVGRFFRGYVRAKMFSKRMKRAQRSWVTGSSSPPGPGANKAGLGLFKYNTKCGTVYGHTGAYPGYRVFAASSANGKGSITYVANAQIVPREGSPEPVASKLIRKSQVQAVCHALG